MGKFVITKRANGELQFSLKAGTGRRYWVVKDIDKRCYGEWNCFGKEKCS